MIPWRRRIFGSPHPVAVARGVWLVAIAGVLALAACGGEPPDRNAGSVAGRVITLDLWAGVAEAGAVALPRINYSAAGVRIQGPVEAEDPVSGKRVPAYERIAAQPEGQRRHLLTITQGGVGLGRVVDQFSGLPERRFSGDVVFPLGLWFPGEMRQFVATEHTLFGPAERLVTIEIVDLDFVHDGVAHSLSYKLTMRDAAGRVLDCEFSVYSPGIGLVRFEAGGQWSDRPDNCPG